MRLSRPRTTAAGIASLAAALALAAATAAPAARAQSLIQPESSAGIAGWTQTGSYNESALSAGEGVATVTPSSGSPYELYRGAASIPLAELVQGWTHIGDPDSVDGYVVRRLPRAPSIWNQKMFLRHYAVGGSLRVRPHPGRRASCTTTPSTRSRRSTQWMVAGEWEHDEPPAGLTRRPYLNQQPLARQRRVAPSLVRVRQPRARR